MGIYGPSSLSQRGSQARNLLCKPTRPLKREQLRDVTHTCRKEDDQNNTYWKGTFLCQTRVGVSANLGDSGAPVFKVQSGDSVKLLGILFGRSTSDYSYSPLGGVIWDLGVNSTWDVCTSGC